MREKGRLVQNIKQLLLIAVFPGVPMVPVTLSPVKVALGGTGSHPQLSRQESGREVGEMTL